MQYRKFYFHFELRAALAAVEINFAIPVFLILRYPGHAINTHLTKIKG
jgi:hypothetical protein